MRKYVWLTLIVFTAGLLRFWHITQVPPALNSDEVAIGYNAYSILKTGRDEYNIQHPLTFRSFDDYKMPVYVYMVSVSMKVFGYNDFAVRFPSALFGTITVLLTYLLSKELLKRWDNKEQISLLAAASLAISPWSLQFSRAGYEANVAVFFVVSGVYLFLLGVKRGWLLILSAFVFALAIWTYLTPRIFVPLLCVGLALIYRKELWKQKSAVIVSLILGFIILFPVLKLSLSPQGQMRASGVSVFGNPDDLKKSAARAMRDESQGRKIFMVFDNRRLTYALTFLYGYFGHFNPNFLFLHQSINKYRAPDVGLLYLFELPLLATGAYMLVRKWSQGSAVLFLWIIISPVAAAFTPPPPHPVRSLVFLPTFQIVSALGLITLAYALMKKKIIVRYLLGALAVSSISLNVVYYLHQYYYVLPVEDARDWYMGRREMTEKINAVKDAYDTVYVSKSLDFPYIFYLYYSLIDPLVYQQQGGTFSGGYEENRNYVGNVKFRSIDTSLRQELNKNLFVGLPTEVFNQQLIIDRVNYPDGSSAIVFFK
jgi:4-amino-4-deoxy-L-arabinose transferase-like glycosyltransferase